MKKRQTSEFFLSCYQVSTSFTLVSVAQIPSKMDHQAVTCLGTHPDSSKSKDWFSHIKGCGRQPGQWRSRSGIATCWNGHARLAGPRHRLMWKAAPIAAWSWPSTSSEWFGADSSDWWTGSSRVLIGHGITVALHMFQGPTLNKTHGNDVPTGQISTSTDHACPKNQDSTSGLRLDHAISW